ncbi:MAG: large conductance mechanosensitive channel protein MscL [Bdellovibrionota bacterium]
MLNDFKKFAFKGSVVDIAIGMIIGGGITPVAKALVDDMIMPVVGLAMGRVDFRNLFVVIKEGSKPAPYETLDLAKSVGAVTVNYGIFVNTIITFIVVAFAAYLIASTVQKLRTKFEEQDVAPSVNEKECPFCLSKVPLAAKKCAYCTSTL